MASFNDLFMWFHKLGVADSLLPFLLVFTVVFAILQQINLFGQDKKNVHIVIALVMGLLFVIPHVTGTYPAGSDPVSIINNAIPSVGIVIIAIIMIMLIVGVFGHTLDVKGSGLAAVVVVFAIGFVIYIFTQARAGWNFPNWLSFLNNPETRAMLIILAVFLIIVFFIIGGGSKSSKAGRGLAGFLDHFKNMLK
jgi:hypothetical protein